MGLINIFNNIYEINSKAFKMVNYTTEERGQLNTLDYKCYIKNAETQEIVSPFHDIPLFQDTKKGKLRYVNNCFPHHGYIWNYGGLPQTWEDPNIVDKETGCIGDNDPLDVCEIGSQILERGTVVQVKVLGALGLIDEGEADWKIMCINVTDPLAEKLNDINDIETVMPGFLDATRDWFKIYKIPTGKPANNFACDGKFYDRAFALDIINHDFKCWENLAKGGYDSEPEKKKGIRMENSTLSDKMSNKSIRAVIDEAKSFVAEPAACDKQTIDTVHYINRANY